MQVNLVDITAKKIYTAEILFDERIISISKINDMPDEALPYAMPGFIDSHVHIESSMLIPTEFARIAVTHGTVATISDPHEIANVCGMHGVHYMIKNGRRCPFKFYFGAPSCVPATTFETAGAELNSDDVITLLQMEEIKYLSEMMNFPGVLHGDEEVRRKIEAAHRLGKPVDGHAPGLRGEDVRKYAAAGISTDHECFTKEEAEEKLACGMKILIREGSAAKNFDALIGLLHQHEDEMMFCSDDKHPDSLVLGHINQLCKRAVEKGVDVFKVLKAACINPVKHYKLNVGLLKAGDPADFILVKNLESFKVLKTYINGQLVAENSKTLLAPVEEQTINNFVAAKITKEELLVAKDKYPLNDNNEIPVIEAIDGQLITPKKYFPAKIENGHIVCDIKNDVLKIVVINRYNKAGVAKAFITNFGFKQGAIASTVAHDSHNVIAVGADDESLAAAINAVMDTQGGVSVSNHGKTDVLPLPVAGLMSNKDGYEVAEQYETIDRLAKSLGSSLEAPFMTLSFMALLVIPHLKLSDKGLFDGDTFSLL